MSQRALGNHWRLPVRIAALVVIAALAHAQVDTPAALRMPKSHNPFSPFTPDHVPEPVLTNSPRLNQMIRDGKLYLSLKDAIYLALEITWTWPLPLQPTDRDTDLLRTQGGGSFRGVKPGSGAGTPGGGVGGFGAGAPGAGAGGTTSGAAAQALALRVWCSLLGRRNSRVLIRPGAQW